MNAPRPDPGPGPGPGDPSTTGHISGVARGELVLGVGLAVLAGILVAVQSRINGELGARLGDGVLAALLSFGGGLLVLLLLLPFTPRARTGMRKVREAVNAGSLRFWQCLGGLGGAALVITQSSTVHILGVAVFTVAVVAGQTGSGLLVDRAGLGPGGRQPPTWPRLIGAAATLVAVAGAMSGRLGGQVAWWLVLLPLLAGCGIAVQQAVNGRVRGSADSALTATLINFLAGMVMLVAVWLVVWAFAGAPTRLPSEPWLYVGGPIGIVFILVAAIVVRWTGVLLFGLSAIAGQLLGAVFLDLTVPAPGVHLRTSTLVGAGVAMLAVGIAALPGSPIGRWRATEPTTRQ